MSNLTRRKALENTRDMWQWIAKTTNVREVPVGKSNYFKEHEIYGLNIPVAGCYACEYATQQAEKSSNDCDKYNGHIMCPIEKWNVGKFSCASGCLASDGEYRKWLDANSWRKSAKYAKQIAELAEQELENL